MLINFFRNITGHYHVSTHLVLLSKRPTLWVSDLEKAARYIKEDLEDPASRYQVFLESSVLNPDAIFNFFLEIPGIGVVKAQLFTVALTNKNPDFSKIIIEQFKLTVFAGSKNALEIILEFYNNYYNNIGVKEVSSFNWFEKNSLKELALYHPTENLKKALKNLLGVVRYYNPSVDLVAAKDKVLEGTSRLVKDVEYIYSTRISEDERYFYSLLDLKTPPTFSSEEELLSELTSDLRACYENFLDDAQRKFIKEVFIGTEKIILLCAPPGTGKSEVLVFIGKVFLLLQERGNKDQILFTSFYNSACDVLQARLGPQYKFLGYTPVRSYMYYRYLEKIVLTKTIQEHYGATPLNFVRVFACDESSTIPSLHLQHHKKIIDSLPKDCKLIYSGDREQTLPIDGGKWFSDVCLYAENKKLPNLHVLDIIHRSSSVGLKDLISKLRGKSQVAIAYQPDQSIMLLQESQACFEQDILSIYARISANGELPFKAHCVIATNKLKDIINEKVFYNLCTDQALISSYNSRKTNPKYTPPAPVEWIGAKVCSIHNCIQNNRIIYPASKIFVVKDLIFEKSGTTLVLTDSAGHSVHANPKDFILGYASTIHAFQGSEADLIVVGLYQSPPHGNMKFYLSMNNMYVSLTRSKKKLVIVNIVENSLRIAIPNLYLSLHADERITFLQMQKEN